MQEPGAPIARAKEARPTEVVHNERLAYVDLGLAAVAILAAAAATIVLPHGSVARVVLAAPILLVVPGYLVMAAFVAPRVPARSRGRHVLIGVGLSPAVVGLVALATSFFPGGFRPAPIVASLTAFCWILVLVAARRRGRQIAPSGRAEGQFASSRPTPTEPSSSALNRG